MGFPIALLAIGTAIAGGIGWLVSRSAKPITPPSGTTQPPAVLPNASITPSAEPVHVAASDSIEARMSPVEYNGQVWLVSPDYMAPMGIGEAADMAAKLGFELPCPGLVDAIWRAADLKIVPPVRAHDGTPKTMSTPEVYAAQKARIDGLIGDRSYKILAGTHKDVVLSDKDYPGLKKGALGLYGWNVEPGKNAGAPTRPPVTPNSGAVIQEPFGGHGKDWKDYSQGARFVKRMA